MSPVFMAVGIQSLLIIWTLMLGDTDKNNASGSLI
jgi:hypothetical protein